MASLKKIWNTFITIMLVASFALPLLPWKLLLPEYVKADLQPEDIALQYQEKDLNVTIDYSYDDLEGLIDLERLEELEGYTVVQDEDGIHVSFSYDYDDMRQSLLNDIHRQQEDRRRKEAAEAVGMQLASYPLDVDSDYFKLAQKVIEIAVNEPRRAENSSGITKYGKYFKFPTAEWCTEFAIWCAIHAEEQLDIPELYNTYPRVTSSGSAISYYKKHGGYFRRGEIIPRMGDLIFFDTDHDGASDHTGLVTRVEYSAVSDTFYVYTIEGNIPGDKPSVYIRQRKFAVTNPIIHGYGTYIVSE